MRNLQVRHCKSPFHHIGKKRGMTSRTILRTQKEKDIPLHSKAERNPTPEHLLVLIQVRLRAWGLSSGAKKIIGATVFRDTFYHHCKLCTM
jgi:hypothetical protein